jgi:hypothetical protein
MKSFVVCVALAACTGASKQERPTASEPAKVDKAVMTLQQHLVKAREESKLYLSGDALPVGAQVRALVEQDARAWWDGLSPLEAFFLFEISPSVASRAPASVRAAAYCAGVADVFSEWWSVPGSPTSETTRHLIESGVPVASCLVEQFDNPKPLHYLDGETSLDAEEHSWTRGDLAAGIVALLLHETYENRAAPDVRTRRRAELRAKVTSRVD